MKKSMICFYFRCCKAATNYHDRNAQVQGNFLQRPLCTCIFVHLDRIPGPGRLLATLKLLNEISVEVRLTNNAYLEIISGEVNLGGVRQVRLLGRGLSRALWDSWKIRRIIQKSMRSRGSYLGTRKKVNVSDMNH